MRGHRPRVGERGDGADGRAVVEPPVVDDAAVHGTAPSRITGDLRAAARRRATASSAGSVLARELEGRAGRRARPASCRGSPSTKRVVLARDARRAALGPDREHRVGRGRRGSAAAPPSRTRPSAHLPLLQQLERRVGLGVERRRASPGCSRPAGRSCGEGLRELGREAPRLVEDLGSRARRAARLSERGRSLRASRESAAIRLGGPGRGSLRRRAPASRTTAERAPHEPHFTTLALRRHLAVLRLEAEVHGLGALLREDARGLLADELLEALELDGRRRLARAPALLDEALVERAHGRGVARRVRHAELAPARGRGRAAGAGRSGGGGGGGGSISAFEPVHARRPAPPRARGASSATAR